MTEDRIQAHLQRDCYVLDAQPEAAGDRIPDCWKRENRAEIAWEPEP